MNRIIPFVNEFKEIFPHRNSRLFTDFLVKGYRETTLNTVGAELLEEVVFAKVCLGMIITLYDDLADNPKFYNPKLLEKLYQLNILRFDIMGESREERLAISLFKNLSSTIAKFPHFNDLSQVLSFDIKHIYLANQYSEAVTQNPSLLNLTEAKTLSPYNMGMVAAGMIDLMASTSYEKAELGKIREIMIRGQRLGRIGNLIATYKREQDEGDLTNEILLFGENHQYALVDEFYSTLLELDLKEFKSFNVRDYTDGIEGLFHFHRSLEGVI